MYQQTASTFPFQSASKAFGKKVHYEWANGLENFVKSLRQDKGIQQLYKRDTVKVCEQHFEESDLIYGNFILFTMLMCII